MAKLRRPLIGFVLAASSIAGLASAEKVSLGHIEASVKTVAAKGKESAKVILDVVLVNNSDSAFFFTEQSPDWDYQLEIRGPDDQPLKLTNYGTCVLPQPSIVFRVIGRKLDAGGKDLVESIELNRLYKLDRAGRYRLTVRRRVSRIRSEYASLSLKDLCDRCSQALCTDEAEAASAPLMFDLNTPYDDNSPKTDPAHCR